MLPLEVSFSNDDGSEYSLVTLRDARHKLCPLRLQVTLELRVSVSVVPTVQMRTAELRAVT